MAEPKKPGTSKAAAKREAERIQLIRKNFADHILLQGLFEEQVLGTFSVIRGFADIRDLAKISVPYLMEDADITSQEAGSVSGHQRPLDTNHAQEIKTYLESYDRRFLPEIILSLRGWWQMGMVRGRGIGVENEVLSILDESGEEPAEGQEANLIAVDRNGHVLSETEGEIEELITIGPLDYDNYDGMHVVTIGPGDEELIREHRLIRRIDGNHRLSAVNLDGNELRREETEPSRYRVSFCLILLGPPSDEYDNFHEAQIFHTINSTALPLESEHALKLILGQGKDYSMSARQEWEFNRPLHLTRLLSEEIRSLAPPVRERLGQKSLVALHRVARNLSSLPIPAIAEQSTAREFCYQLAMALGDAVTRLNPVCPGLCQSAFFVDLVALAWLEQLEKSDRDERINQTVALLEKLALWLGRDGLHSLEADDSLPTQLLQIYKSSLHRVPKKLFLARWNTKGADGDNHSRAELRLQQIKRALDDLRLDGIDLELIDIDSEKRGTHPIPDRLFDAINSSDLILIDLTGNRPNVCIEAGYALERHKAERLLFLFHKVRRGDVPPFDLGHFTHMIVSSEAEIPDQLKPNIKAIMGRAN